MNNHSKFIISTDLIHVGKYHLVSSSPFSVLDDNFLTAFVFSNSNLLCPKIFIPHFEAQAITFFFVLLIIRFHFLFLSIHPKKVANYLILFAGTNGNILCFSCSSFLLINKIRQLWRCKSDCHILFHLDSKLDILQQSHLYKIVLDKNIVLYLIWTDFLSDVNISWCNEIEGGLIMFNGSDEISTVTALIQFDKSSFPIVQIPIPQGQKKIYITIEPIKFIFPILGYFSLIENYLLMIYLNLISNRLADINSLSSLKKLINSLICYLDYTCLCMYSITGTSIVSIIECFDSRISKQEVDLFLKEITENLIIKRIPIKYLLQSESGYHSFYFNVFRFGNINYLVLVGFHQNNYALCSSEIPFLYKISMLLSYHHSITHANIASSSFARILNLIEKSPKIFFVQFSFKEFSKCSIFGMANQLDFFHEVFQQLAHNLKIFQSPLQNCKRLVQQIDIHLETMVFSIIPSSFYSISLQKEIYIYLVENITFFLKVYQEFRICFHMLNLSLKL
jgi:hypothetical protein